MTIQTARLEGSPEIAALESRAIRRGERRRDAGIVLAGRLGVIAVLIFGWELASTRTNLVPSVMATLRKLVEGFTEGRFGSPLWASMQAILEGFGVAAAVALGVGLFLGRSRFWGLVFEPILTTFYAIPRIILYPVLLGFFGVGLTSERSLAILSAFFPIVINTIAGIRSVNPNLAKLGRSVSASRLQLARHILIPAAAPAIMVGVRIGWASAFVTVIAAELFASKSGIGQQLETSYNLLQYSTMFAVVLLVTLIALIGNFVLKQAEGLVRASVE